MRVPTALRRLIETKPDDISPLDGRTLVAKKVKLWVAMACKYPDGKATALDFVGMELGSAKAALKDGWYEIEPVQGAFSYRIAR